MAWLSPSVVSHCIRRPLTSEAKPQPGSSGVGSFCCASEKSSKKSRAKARDWQQQAENHEPVPRSIMATHFGRQDQSGEKE